MKSNKIETSGKRIPISNELIENIIKDFQKIKVEKLHNGNYAISIYNPKEEIILGHVNDDEIASQIFKKNIDEINKEDWDWYDTELGSYDKEQYAKEYWNEAVIKKGHLKMTIREALKALQIEDKPTKVSWIQKMTS